MFFTNVDRQYTADHNEFYVAMLGDIHGGNPACDEKKLLRHVAAMPENAMVIIMGDVMEWIDFKDKRFDMSSIHPRFYYDMDRIHLAQTEWIADEVLAPIADRIILWHDGNHEVKLHPTYAPGYEVCRRLGILDRYCGMQEGMTRIRFVHEAGGKARVLRVNTHHGWQAGRMAGAKHNELGKMLSYIGADIVVRGHSHELFATPAHPRIEGNKDWTRLIERKRYTGMSGSYFRSRMEGQCSYAERAQYPPLPTGHVRYRVELRDESGTGGTGYELTGEVVA